MADPEPQNLFFLLNRSLVAKYMAEKDIVYPKELPEEYNAWIAKNRLHYPGTQIGLMCLGDEYDYYQFISRIVPDGSDTPLVDMLSNTIFGKLAKDVKHQEVMDLIYKDSGLDEYERDSDFTFIVPHVRCFRALLEFCDNEDSEHSLEEYIPKESEWHANVKTINGHTCIRFTFGGLRYVVACTKNKHDTARLNDYLQKPKNGTWRVHHSCIIQAFLKKYRDPDTRFLKYGHKGIQGTVHNPNCMQDLQCALYITNEMKKELEILFNALPITFQCSLKKLKEEDKVQ